MKSEYKAEDFAKAVKNPYYHKLNTDVKIGIRNEDYDLFKKYADESGVEIETIIKRCLIDYARMLREDED